ncbi:unnamed protein product [Litomosoides sigmodontis]|uniref:Uncharacterized protein n=1 Tax=Litomosoides sigmodontis TaxID=42156 RepID=A0A3P6TYC8_LITSI|nr:unnamed protein product [Litomosoides sigmodontis]
MDKNGTGWNDMVARNLPECRAHVRKKISTQVRIYGLTVGYLTPAGQDGTEQEGTGRDGTGRDETRRDATGTGRTGWTGQDERSGEGMVPPLKR